MVAKQWKCLHLLLHGSVGPPPLQRPRSNEEDGDLPVEQPNGLVPHEPPADTPPMQVVMAESLEPAEPLVAAPAPPIAGTIAHLVQVAPRRSLRNQVEAVVSDEDTLSTAMYAVSLCRSGRRNTARSTRAR